MKRNATAVWNGTGKEGNGHLSTQSSVLNKTQYSFNSRFEEGIGTNPEELIAAAHAGCFAMKLSFVLLVIMYPMMTDVVFALMLTETKRCCVWLKISEILLPLKTRGITMVYTMY